MRFHSWLFGFLVLVLVGCEVGPPSQVILRGWVVDGGNPQVYLGAATVIAVSREGSMEELGRTTSFDDGYFAIGGLPPAKPVALVVGKPSTHSWGVFTGNTETQDLTLFVGAVFAPPHQETLDMIGDYRLAPGAPGSLVDFEPDFEDNATGGMVRGRAGQWHQGELGLAFLPLEGVAVDVTTDSDTHAVCYHAAPPIEEDLGEADCTAGDTSEDSRFAAFGLPAGPVTVTLTLGEDVVEDRTLIVEDGVTYLDFFAMAPPS